MSQNAIQDLENILTELNRSHVGRRLFLSLAPQLLLACSSLRKSNQSESLSIEDEILMSKEALPEMRRDYPALQNAEIQNYISDLGSRIVATNGLANRPYDYSFTVVHVPTINAFALPAGKIFVTAPLIALTETEAELAGVLSHEIGHITARHAALRIDAARKAKSESWWYGLGGAAVSGAVGYGASSVVCQGVEGCVNRLVLSSAVAGIHGGLLIQKYRFLGNSIQNELEADRIGFDLSLKAGYSAQYIGNFYSRVQKIQEDKYSQNSIKSKAMDSLKTHPHAQERTAQLELFIQNSLEPEGTISTLDFDQIRKRASELIAPV